MTLAEQLDFLTRNASAVHSRAELEAKLKTGRPLRVKLGFDPTSPNLHLGHSVVLDRIADFQKLGHTAVIIIGDYTARIGDPTGRSKARAPLSPEQVQENAETYIAQVYKILDPSKTEIRYNGEWFDKFSYADVLKLNAQISVAQLLEREDFKKRYTSGQSITLTEFQYPLMQGYDSVMIQADVELGGNDQLFNNLVGRDLQRAHGQEAQVVMVMPILEGTDGVEKMSKSLGNAIGITEPAQEIFGKTMQISDELMVKWYHHLFHETLDSAMHPMEAKKRLASRLVARYHGEGAGGEARAEFERIFSKKELPTDLKDHTPSENPIWIVKLLVEAGACASNGDARRLVQQGAVSLDGEKITDPQAKLTVQGKPVLQCGKRFFVRLQGSQVSG